MFNGHLYESHGTRQQGFVNKTFYDTLNGSEVIVRLVMDEVHCYFRC